MAPGISTLTYLHGDGSRDIARYAAASTGCPLPTECIHPPFTSCPLARRARVMPLDRCLFCSS